MSTLSSEVAKFNSRAPLDRSPKKNWVENSGGLPMYIRRIANHIHAKGMSIGHAIAVAVNAVKKMCASGDVNFPGRQSVNAGSRAEACAAVASWERKKAGARVSKGVFGRKWTDEEFIAFLTSETDIEKQFNGCGIAKCVECGGGCGEDPKKRGKKKKRVKKSLPAEISDDEFDELVSDLDAPSDQVEFDMQGEIEKSDNDKQLVFGWCSIAKHADGTVEVDKQGDVLEDIDQMEAVAYDFVLHSRDGGEMHVRKGVSTLVESFVSTPEKWEAMNIPEGTLPTGWWVGFKVNDTEVWKAVKSGKYKMFSVHGSGTRKALEDE